MQLAFSRSASGPQPQERTVRPSWLLTMVATTLLVILGWSTSAYAHAGLVSSNPSNGAVVRESPKEIVLSFTEGVSVQADGVRVLDGTGKRVDAGQAKSVDNVVTAPVDGTLPRGGYAVSWRITSADGHPVAGTFTFSVGTKTELSDDVASGAFAGSHDTRDKTIAAVLRFVVYLAVLGLGGMALVGHVLRRGDTAPVVNRLMGSLGAVGALAALAQLPLQASLVTGAGWGSITKPGVLRQVLQDGIGLSTGLVVIGLLAAAITAGLDSTRSVQITAMVGAVLAALGLPITGHTRTMSPKVVAYVADFAHVIAGAVWFGGLIALVAVIKRRRDESDLVGAGSAVATFSTAAAVTVAVLAVAGTIMGWIETGSLSALTSTSYGALLLAKVAVVAAVLVGAWWNRSKLVPLLTASDEDDDHGNAAGDGDWSRFRTVMLLEIIGIVVAIALTAVLVNLTPGKAAAVKGPVTVETELGAGRVEVTVDPGNVGANVVHVYVKNRDGVLDTRMERVDVKLSLPSQNLPPITAPIVKVGPGHFQIVNVAIPFPGDWQIDVIARIDTFTEITAKVTVPIR